MADERWLSVDDVAAYLGVKRFTVYRWIDSRGLPAHKRGKLWLLRKHEVDRWVLLGRGGARRTQTAAQQVSHLPADIPPFLCCQGETVEPELYTRGARSAGERPVSGPPGSRDRISPGLSGVQDGSADSLGGLLHFSARSVTSVPESANSQVGVVMGLAAGVDMPVRIEALTLTGTGQVAPAGTVLRVMQDSVAQAVAFAGSHLAELGISRAALELTDIVLVADVGDIPVQTDSLGAAVALCLTSALGGTRIRRWTATAGRLQPDGYLEPVADVAQRLRAAVRGGIREVFLPQQNASEAAALPFLRDWPVKIMPVSHVNEVIQLASVRGQLDMFKMAGNGGSEK